MSKDTKTPAILIVSYFFPPNPDIGGKRWAKFSKYLANFGYSVNIISASYSGNQQSGMEDLNMPKNIQKYELVSRYPKILQKTPNGLLEKIYYRLWLAVMNFLVKGTIYDVALFLEKPMIRLCSELIEKHNIKNVIVTGAPFRLLFYATKLKEQYDINLICDFRDPWIWGTGYGFPNLSKKRFSYEKSMQDEVIKKANYILAPSENMINELCDRYKSYKDKIIWLPHGFDIDDFKNLGSERNKDDDTKISFVYAGSIYDGVEASFDAIVEVLTELKEKKAELFGKIVMEFYTNSNLPYRKFHDSVAKDIVKTYGFVQQKELFKRISYCDYVLVIFPKYKKNFLSTRFFEVFYLKKPIIYIGEEGLISEFLVENNLGFHFSNETLKEQFYSLLTKSEKYYYNDHFEVDHYSYKVLTKKLEKLLS